MALNSSCADNVACSLDNTANHQHYIAWRVVLLFVWALVSIHSLFRLVVVIWFKHIKPYAAHHREEDGCCSRDRMHALFFDAQLQTVGLVLVCGVLGTVSWVDLYGFEVRSIEAVLFVIHSVLQGILPRFLALLLSGSSGTIGLLSAVRTLHFFVSMHSRFHAPSRLVATALVVVSIPLVIAVIATWILQHQAAAVTINLVVLSTTIVFLIVGMSCYGVELIKVSKRPEIARTVPREEQQSRDQLLVVIRVMQVCASIVILTGVGEYVFPVGLGNLYCNCLLQLDTAVCVTLIAAFLGRVRGLRGQAQTRISAYTVKVLFVRVCRWCCSFCFCSPGCPPYFSARCRAS